MMDLKADTGAVGSKKLLLPDTVAAGSKK